jgi:hypothetical protein
MGLYKFIFIPLIITSTKEPQRVTLLRSFGYLITFYHIAILKLSLTQLPQGTPPAAGRCHLERSRKISQDVTGQLRSQTKQKSNCASGRN